MSLDREVCLCFHVTKRKLVNFARNHQPKHVSQMSECFGAGTGCGWCRPFLAGIFNQARSESQRTLAQTFAESPELGSPIPPVPPDKDQGSRPFIGEKLELDDWSVDQYTQRRQEYIRSRKSGNQAT
jgi:bacterioferritin-associated ferredoxin